ncbi:MAG: hypothetical protein U0136_08900 [Bdellovibrionota bacterium]
MSYRNDRTLYKTTCGASGRPILSMYDPASGFTVYDYKEWWSDRWDPRTFARPFEPGRSFIDQFMELRAAVPRFNLYNKSSENCDYVNYAPHCRNCYLLFGSWFSEDCYYGQSFFECTNCSDGLFLEECELCYECVDCAGCYNSSYCQNCSKTSESFFCFDCHNVQNCIGCFNLRNARYCVDNKQVTPEEFESLAAEFQSRRFIQTYAAEFLERRKRTAIHKAATGLNNENVSGDFIYNCKNAKFCFSVYGSEDIAYCSRTDGVIRSYDYEGGGKGELIYDSMSNDFAYSSIACTTSEHLSYSHYCDICFNCSNCFGCVGMRNAEYCILNRQRTEEEYRSEVQRIIVQMTDDEEWGEFFPMSASPFAYNETLAQEYFPISEEQAATWGVRWKDKVRRKKGAGEVIADRIEETDPSIVKVPAVCPACAKSFRIIPQEILFHQSIRLPLSPNCPDCRHYRRMRLRNPRQLWRRSCDRCRKPVETTYDPSGPEKVYCENCYHAALF